jgi:hypothetical protein
MSKDTNTNTSFAAKVKEVARKFGDTEEYREDERRARAYNDPKNTTSFKEQLKGGRKREERK